MVNGSWTTIWTTEIKIAATRGTAGSGETNDKVDSGLYCSRRRWESNDRGDVVSEVGLWIWEEETLLILAFEEKWIDLTALGWMRFFEFVINLNELTWKI